MHKSAFINIVGLPNVGKSTLLNELVGEPISIVTNKKQTTRHNILGILNTISYQLIFCDTPGWIKPFYPLQESMMKAVYKSMEGADIMFAVASLSPKEENSIEFVQNYCKKYDLPTAIILNKVDLASQEQVKKIASDIQKNLPRAEIFVISALHKHNIDSLINFALSNTPEHEPYYDKDIISDKSLRFIAAEKIREQIFVHFKQEIPYSVEVIVDNYKEQTLIDHIYARIIVERDSQKGIIIGAKGLALKKIASAARKNIEKFLKKKVFLEIFVKTIPNWRYNKNFLESQGYE